MIIDWIALEIAGAILIICVIIFWWWRTREKVIEYQLPAVMTPPKKSYAVPTKGIKAR